jgi:hypothetical protein
MDKKQKPVEPNPSLVKKAISDFESGKISLKELKKALGADKISAEYDDKLFIRDVAVI